MPWRSRKASRPLLDLLRFTAALTVFLHHANWLHLDGGALSWFRRDVGHSAVVIFFVLSGYVIAATLRPGATALDYAIKRASRIYSVAVPAVLLTMAIDLGCQHWGVPTPAPAYQLHHPLPYAGAGADVRRRSLDAGRAAILEPAVLVAELRGLVLRGVRRVRLRPGRLALGGAAARAAIMGPKLWFLFPIWIGGVVVLRAQRRWTLAQGPARAVAIGAVLTILALEGVPHRGPDQRRRRRAGGFGAADLAPLLAVVPRRHAAGRDHDGAGVRAASTST